MKKAKNIFTSLYWRCLQVILVIGAAIAPSELLSQRFPKPEFESGYLQPETQVPIPRSDMMEYFDILVLIIALSVITWFILKKRSRTGVFWTGLFSIVYFGFYREGCICSVGSVQNVALALFNPEYSIPITALAFFVIPLIFTLFFGRTFCAGVCPLGAIQDIFLWKPLSLSTWTKKALGLIPYLYLGFAILYAATATDFIICRYDPFIGIYRFNAEFSMFALGGTFLITSIFIGRPYCRFFCPYGVILNWFSRISSRHMKITPSACIQCKLCENSCPFDAIEQPDELMTKIPREKLAGSFIKRLAMVPVFILIGIAIGYLLHPNFAMVDSTVSLAYEVLELEQNPAVTQAPDYTETIQIEAFRSSGQSVQQLYNDAILIIDKFRIGSIWLGAFIGLIFGLLLANLSTFRYRKDYEPHKGDCFSCARCMDYCPVDSSEKLIEKK